MLTDNTDGQSFTESTAYSSSELTAEWIVETPVVVGTGGTGVAKLPNLGEVHFTNAEVNGERRLACWRRSSSSIRRASRFHPFEPVLEGKRLLRLHLGSTCKA